MREIKFRAWNKKRKRMYEVLHLHAETLDNGGLWATVKGRNCIEDKDIHIQIQPKDIVVMQYTGLTDRNGKEIYEGAIVEVTYRGGEVERFKVYYELDRARYSFEDQHGTDWGWSKSNEMEVIGNIYENPELLEVTK
jgi:uncharacterized phage protein (TIGR01671 family)